MVRKILLTSLLASSALALAVSSPASAGQKDRAREAIAAAEAKINTANTLGAGVEVPGESAAARASLSRAKEDLASGRKAAAIDEAIHASALADTAIGELQRRKDASVASARASERESAAAARESVAEAHDRAAVAEQQAAVAQGQAANAQDQAAGANARASAAEQAAASAAADAAAARSAALTAQAQPTQVETTVTTVGRNASTRPATTKSRVVKRTTPAATTTVTRPAATSTLADQVTTTTTVTGR